MEPLQPPFLISLPLTVLDQIARFLPRSDLESLALVHTTLTKCVRERRTRGNALLHSSQELRDLRSALGAHPGLASLQLVLVNPRPLRGFASFFAACKHLRSLRLWLGTPAAFEGRGAWRALASGCPSLTSLAVKDLGGAPLDLSCDLSPLSKLTGLKELTLEPLLDDASVGRLTQLTALALAFPAHPDTCPDHLMCSNCRRPHLEDSEDLAEYLEALPEEGVVLGDTLGRLPLLHTLRLDFAAYEDGTGPEALLNRFIFSEAEAERLGGPAARPWFPSLRRVEAVNVLGPRHFLYDDDIESGVVAATRFAGMRPLQLHNPCRLWALFEGVPSLQEFLLQAGVDEGEDVDKQPGEAFVWLCPCGAGQVEGEMVVTASAGLAYRVRRPKAPAEGGVRPPCLEYSD